MIWSDIKTQIKNYNINYKIYSIDEFSENEYLINNIIKLALIKFNEYANSNFKRDYNLNNFPTYLLKEDLNFMEIKKKINQNKKEEIRELFGIQQKNLVNISLGMNL